MTKEARRPSQDGEPEAIPVTPIPVETGEDVAYIFSDGGFLIGIPSRDLTFNDVAALTEEQRATLEANSKMESGIYRRKG